MSKSGYILWEFRIQEAKSVAVKAVWEYYAELRRQAEMLEKQNDKR